MAAICVESGVGAHVDDATLAWAYDLRWWGLCGQGTDEPSALDDLCGRALRSYQRFVTAHGGHPEPLGASEVVERIHGDEQAFEADLRPPSGAEVARTRTVLRWARKDLVELVTSATAEELDRVDAERQLPSWASWHTLRDMGWHIADTESRYYLARLGVDAPPRAQELLDELHGSHRHVAAALPRLPGEVVRTSDGEVWTARKVLRRLAWHERSELDAMRELLTRIRARAGES